MKRQLMIVLWWRGEEKGESSHRGGDDDNGLDTCEVPGMVLIVGSRQMRGLNPRPEAWKADSGKPTTEDTRAT